MKQLFMMIFALNILGAPAQADWTAMDPSRGFGAGAIGCATGGDNFQCLALRCKAGRTTLALILTGGDLGQGEPVPVYLRIDGAPAVQLTMMPIIMSGTLEAETTFDSIVHAGLIADLKRGSMVSISVWVSTAE